MKDTELGFIEKMIAKMDDLSVAVVNNMDKETFVQYTEALTSLIDKTNPLNISVEIGARQLTEYGNNRAHLVGFKFHWERPQMKEVKDD